MTIVGYAYDMILFESSSSSKQHQHLIEEENKSRCVRNSGNNDDNDDDDSNLTTTLTCSDCAFYFDHDSWRQKHKQNDSFDADDDHNHHHDTNAHNTIQKNSTQMILYLVVPVIKNGDGDGNHDADSNKEKRFEIVEKKIRRFKTRRTGSNNNFKISEDVIHSNNSTSTIGGSFSKTTKQTLEHDPNCLKALHECFYDRTSYNSRACCNSRSSSHPETTKVLSARYELVQHTTRHNTKEGIQEYEEEIVTIGRASFNIHLWNANHDEIILVDIDGTITKSTLRGFLITAIVLPIVLGQEQNKNYYYHHHYYDYYCHDGVCRFFTTLLRNTNCGNKKQSFRIVYVSNRPITYINSTRLFLQNVKQQRQSSSQQVLQHEDNCDSLPNGPIIGSTTVRSLWDVIRMDYWDNTASRCKYDTIYKYILKPYFVQQQQHMHFHATNRDNDKGINITASGTSSIRNIPRSIIRTAFGNTYSDMSAYHAAGVACEQMFYITKQSIIYCMDHHLYKENNNSNNNDDDYGDRSSSGMSYSVKDYDAYKGTPYIDGYNDESLLQRILL